MLTCWFCLSTKMENKVNWTAHEKQMNAPYNKFASFVCIEHPAVIKNVDKALETLGGQEKVSEVYRESSQRMPIHLRPDDLFCKPVYGDRQNTTNLLLKVKRRRRKADSTCEYSTEVLGKIETTYKYKTMADFQYLPVTKNKDGQYESFHDRIIVKGFEEREEFMNRDVPCFVPPVLFSRVDQPVDMFFKQEIDHRKNYQNPDKMRPAHIIGTVRQRRSIHTIFVNFGEKIPHKPVPEADATLRTEFLDPKWETELRELFEDKPLWLKNNLMDVITFPQKRLKMILPLVAFYWLDGPWRVQWCRLGYDPRTKPETKIYQTLDYRVGPNVTYSTVTPKRGMFKLSQWNQVSRNPVQVAKINVASLEKSDNKNIPTTTEDDKEMYYVFKPNKLPPNRSMYYQLKNILLDEVQSLIHQNDGQETTCNEKDGWCVTDIGDKVREIMNRYVMRLVEQGKTLEEKFAAQHSRRKGKKKKTGGGDEDEDDIQEDEEEEMEQDLGGTSQDEEGEEEGIEMDYDYNEEFDQD